MSESTTSSDAGTQQRTGTNGSSGTGSPLSSVVRYVRRAASSGLLAGASGTLNLLGALRAFRDGSTRKAARYSLMGAFWLVVAAVQRRSRRGRSGGSERSGGVDQTDVVDTAPDVENVSAGSEPDASGGASIEVTDASPAPDVEGDVPTGDVDKSDVVDTEPDVEDVEAQGTAEDTDGVEDLDEADGVENARDAEGMADVDQAEGVTDVEGENEDGDESEE